MELVDLKTLYAHSDYITLHVALTPETDSCSTRAFAQMKHGVRIVNCARGELIDRRRCTRPWHRARSPAQALDVFDQEPPAADDSASRAGILIATPHIGGSTEEAQEIVGVRIVRADGRIPEERRRSERRQHAGAVCRNSIAKSRPT